MSFPLGSIPFSGIIGTSGSSDTYPVTTDELNLGGYRAVADTTARDAITTSRRKFGMMVAVQNTSPATLYVLCNVAMGGNSNTLSDNTNWIQFNSGGVTSVNLATGVVTLTVANTGSVLQYDPTTKTQLNIPTATSSINGLLSSTDWTTFNSKQSALGFTPENVANKATSFAILNNTLYPTTQAVATYVGSLVTGVSSVSNSDGTLTISPTTGAVVASLALGHANTWTATQTFTPASASLKPLIVQGYASQTANLQEWQNSSATALAYVDANGNSYFNSVNVAAYPSNGYSLNGVSALSTRYGITYLNNVGNGVSIGNGIFLASSGANLTGLTTTIGGTSTSNSRISILAGLGASAWGTAGIGFVTASGGYQDNSTTAGSTVATNMVHVFNVPTLISLNATSGSNVTYSNAATLYIDGAPAAGTNVTISTPWSLYVNNGNIIANNGSIYAGTKSYFTNRYLKLDDGVYFTVNGFGYASNMLNCSYTSVLYGTAYGFLSLSGFHATSGTPGVFGVKTLSATEFTVGANLRTFYGTGGTSYWTPATSTLVAVNGNFTSNDIGMNIFAQNGAYGYVVNLGNIISVVNSTTVVVTNPYSQVAFNINTNTLFSVEFSPFTVSGQFVGHNTRAPSALLHFGTSGFVRSSSWGTSGIGIRQDSLTLLDTSATASSTVTNNMVNSLGASTLTAINTLVTYTNAATLYIAGAPTAGTNVTITNPYSLYVAGGASYFGGSISLGSFTQGSVLFAGSGGAITQNNAQFFWDNTNNRLGLGTSSPSYTLDVNVPSATGDSILRIKNNEASGSHNSQLRLETNYYAGYAYIQINGANVTTPAGSTGYDLVIYNPTGGSTGSNIFIGTASSGLSGRGQIRFASQSSTVQMALLENGTLSVGAGLTALTSRVGITDTTLAGSGSLAGNVLNLAQTWNTTGAPTAVLLNVTNTASGTNAKLLDLQISSNSKINVDKNGKLSIGASATSLPAWGTTGVALNSVGSIFTDNSTAASGTVTYGAINALQAATIAATNAGVTYTNAATLYLSGPPIAGTNVTITNSAVLQIAPQSGDKAIYTYQSRITMDNGNYNGNGAGIVFFNTGYVSGQSYALYSNAQGINPFYFLGATSYSKIFGSWSSFDAYNSAGLLHVTENSSTLGKLGLVQNNAGNVSIPFINFGSHGTSSGNVPVGSTQEIRSYFTNNGSDQVQMGAFGTIMIDTTNSAYKIGYFWKTSTSGVISETMRLSGLYLGIGVTSPTAYVHAAASTTAAASYQIPSGTAPTSPNNGDLWYDGTHLYFRKSTTNIDLLGSGFGTVTSVGLSMPSIFTVSGSPVTSSGTLSASLNTQSANLVFAGPSSGSAATPTFRNLVNADLPTSGVTAGSYTNANVTVNAQGIITSVSSGAAGGVTSITGTDGITPTSLTTGAVTLGLGSNLTLGSSGQNLIADFSNNIYLGNTGGPFTSTSGGTFIGNNAGYGSSGANNSVFIGFSAGLNTTAASASYFFGTSAGAGATYATGSNFFGNVAGQGATNASTSNFFGAGAGYMAAHAFNSNFFGPSAGYNATYAANSVFIGYNVGYNDTVNNTVGSGKYSILIGINSNTGGYSNSIVLGTGTNTQSHEFLIDSAITNWNFQGTSYVLPNTATIGVLQNNSSNNWSWSTILTDTSAISSLDFNARYLYNYNGAIVVDYSGSSVAFNSDYFTPTTGSTITSTGARTMVLNPSGTIATLTVNFPSSPNNNQEFKISSTQTITSLTLSGGSGITVDGSVSTLSANSAVGWIYISSISTWIRTDLIASGGGSGTVTSVGLSLPSIFSVSGSPVTSSGTLTASLATQNANVFFAGPTSGSAAAPTFRSLVAADLPFYYSGGHTVTTSGLGSIALGSATGGNISATNNGAFAVGSATTGNITASGAGSFAWGDAISATNTHSFALGVGYTNSSANTFTVGFGLASLSINTTSVTLAACQSSYTPLIIPNGTTAPSSPSTGALWTTSNGLYYQVDSSHTINLKNAAYTWRSITIDNPVSGLIFPIGQLGGQTITITQIFGTVLGGTNCVFQLEKRSSSTLNSSGTNIMSSSLTATQTGANTVSFGSANLSALDFIVLNVGSTSGPVTQLVITIVYIITS
jgi:hypothetical protein